MFAVVVFLFIGSLIAMYLVRSRSVLFSSGAKGDPFGEPGICIFNPFRDRGPERSAERFLETLKAGQYEQALAPLQVSDEQHQYLQRKEEQHPLESWTLKNRQDQINEVKLFFWHSRTDSDLQGQLWITVEKRNEQWQVTGYECIY